VLLFFQIIAFGLSYKPKLLRSSLRCLWGLLKCFVCTCVLWRIVDAPAFKEFLYREDLQSGMVTVWSLVETGACGFSPHRLGEIFQTDQNANLSLLSLDHATKIAQV
jgi:hypothetical protein